MTLFELWFTSLLVGFSGAVTPGPVLSIAISETAKKGFLAGPLIVVGHSVVELAMVIALSFGASQLMTVQAFTKGVAIVGGLVLFWMGVAMVFSALRGNNTLSRSESNGARPSLAGTVVMGAVATLSNPYWFVWWGTVGVLYVVKSMSFGTAGLTVFYTGHILSDLLWYSAVGLIITLSRTFLSDVAYRVIIAVCGLFLVGIGVYFINSGIYP